MRCGDVDYRSPLVVSEVPWLINGVSHDVYTDRGIEVMRSFHMKLVSHDESKLDNVWPAIIIRTK